MPTLIEPLLIALAVAMVTQRTRRPYTIALVIWGLILGLLQLIEPVRLTLFWEIVAFLVNSVVFLLIGFELRPDQLLDDLLLIALVFVVLLATRALMVYGLGALAHWRQRNLPRRWRHVIVWGGLRGAVPVALALGPQGNCIYTPVKSWFSG